MADIRVVWDPDQFFGDDRLDGKDLDGTRELVTAIAIALFTDRTALDDDVLPDELGTSRRGWWADADAEQIHGGWPIGSRLWLLSREKQTDETRNRAEAYIREAIDPFVTAKIVAGYDLEVDWFEFERLGAEITLYRGSDVIAVRFEKLWDGIKQ